MADIFISFIHEQEAVAKAVKKAVETKLKQSVTSHAERVFLSADEWQVFAGEIWLDRIREELSSAHVVLLLLSKESVSRPWVNFEAGAAWLTGDKAIIPVCFGGLTKDSLPKPYSGIQALNLPEETDYLVNSIFHHLREKSKQPLGLTPLPFSPEDQCLVELRNAISKLGSR